jgi:N6-L-threonylcarbamoyladenine synthase
MIRDMLILGIESSCDETAVALIERGENNRVLAEYIKSQIPLHAKFGGVVPEIASRSHYETIDLLLKKLIEDARIDLSDIDLIAATQGPGLIGSLLIGFMFAKTLAYSLKKPFVPVNHIDAHLDAVEIESDPVKFPALGLVVSGGHTSLYFMENKFDRQVVAKTRDDAIGEVMDKVAKFFCLGYPGGPILDQLSVYEKPKRFKFSTPKMSDGSMDFSFSGYKTSIIRQAQNFGINQFHPDFPIFISDFSHAILDYVITQIDFFSQKHNPSTVIISGGVSRNTLLRVKALSFFPLKNLFVRFPKPDYCTDNAAMVAWRAYDVFQKTPTFNYNNFCLTPYSRSLPNSSNRHR